MGFLLSITIFRRTTYTGHLNWQQRWPSNKNIFKTLKLKIILQKAYNPFKVWNMSIRFVCKGEYNALFAWFPTCLAVIQPCIMQFMASRGCPNIFSYSNFVPQWPPCGPFWSIASSRWESADWFSYSFSSDKIVFIL